MGGATMGIIEIIEAAAAILWLYLGIYVGVKARRILSRMDQVVAELERDVQP